jgi:dipeptidyl aminopeptidase/acylaminoacyl peptidase
MVGSMGRRLEAMLCAAALVALLAPGAAIAAFPGANGKIAFPTDPPPTGGPSGIAAVAPDGQDFAQLTPVPASGNDYDPSYSADGERIAFSRVPQPANSGQIWTMNADGSDQVQLTDGTPTAADSNPEFSPDGSWIVFARYNGVNNTQIWRMRADGSEQTQLTFGPDSRGPSFSPDGSTIVFERGTPSGARIWVMNADGSGTPQQLSTGPMGVIDSDPSYSPDGQRIVFWRFGGGAADILTMNADGSNPGPVVATSAFEVEPEFSPDGTKIAYVRGSGDLYLADPDGANQTQVPEIRVYPESSIGWQPLNPPACQVTGEPKQRSFKQIEVTVTCSNEDATATLFGVGEAKKVPKGATASKKKRFDIPPVSAQVPAGAPTLVSLQIPKKGRKALKRAARAGKKGKAAVTATLTDGLGQTSQATLNVTFKKKKRR